MQFTLSNFVKAQRRFDPKLRLYFWLKNYPNLILFIKKAPPKRLATTIFIWHRIKEKHATKSWKIKNAWTFSYITKVHWFHHKTKFNMSMMLHLLRRLKIMTTPCEMDLINCFLCNGNNTPCFLIFCKIVSAFSNISRQPDLIQFLQLYYSNTKGYYCKWWSSHRWAKTSKCLKYRSAEDVRHRCTQFLLSLEGKIWLCSAGCSKLFACLLVLK